MADVNQAMSAADHALAHALTALVCLTIYDRGRVLMLRAVLTDAGRASQSTNPHIVALKDAAREFLRSKSDGPEHCRARLTACDAIARFSEWRLGMVLEKSPFTPGKTTKGKSDEFQ